MSGSGLRLVNDMLLRLHEEQIHGTGVWHRRPCSPSGDSTIDVASSRDDGKKQQQHLLTKSLSTQVERKSSAEPHYEQRVMKRLMSLRSQKTKRSSDMDENSACESSKLLKKKTVTFHSQVRQYHILHVKDMTEEEISSKWVSDEEFLESKKRNASDLRRYDRGEITKDNEEEFCARGLERKIKRASVERKQLQRQARAAVLEEQEIQRDRKVQDGRSIRTAYMMFSYLAIQRARELARLDSEEAIWIHSSSGKDNMAGVHSHKRI